MRPTAIYPRDAEVLDLFARLGAVIAVDQEKRFEALCVITATMAAYFRDGGPAGEAALGRLRAYGDEPGRELPPDEVAAYRALLNPELFFAEARLDFYERLLPRMRDRLFFIIYNFLPWLQPGLFTKCGLLVDPTSVGEVGLAIFRLLTDDAMRVEMGRNGRQAHLDELNYERQFAPALAQMVAWSKS